MATAAITTENESFLRICHLLMAVGTDVMRKAFEDLHRPSSVDAVLRRNERKLKKLPRRVLNPKMRSTLFPGGNSYGKITDFDITLLSVLFRHICGLNPPVAQTGQRSWDEEPFTSDHSLAADLVRLKRYRNTICAHATSTEMPRDEFDRTWDDIATVLKRMGGQSVKLKVDCLRDAPFTELEVSYSKDLDEWYKDEQQLKDNVDEVKENVKEVKENVKEVKENVKEVKENVEEIKKNVEEAKENVEENKKNVEEVKKNLEKFHRREQGK